MKKSIVLAVMAILAILFSGSAYAAEGTETIVEKELKVISVEENGQYKKITSLVEITGEQFVKVHTIRSYDEMIAHHVRYINVQGCIKKVISWQEKNGRKIFPKGKKPVEIITHKA